MFNFGKFFCWGFSDDKLGIHCENMIVIKDRQFTRSIYDENNFTNKTSDR